MMESISVRRWTVRGMGLLVLGAAMAGGARGQSSPSAKLPKITYTKNTVFHLPVQMDERTRANLREVCLYVKAGAADWARQETGVPSLSHFSYKVPRDGEYWFSLITIDKQGKMTPADVSQEAPGLRVLVDTQPPVLDVQSQTTPEGDFCLRCQVQDTNPDPQSLKASYRDQTGEHVLAPVPGSPNLFKIVGRELLNQPLKFTAVDLCGNATSREVNVKEMAVAALQANKNIASKAGQGARAVEAAPTLPSLPTETVKTEVQRPASLPNLSEKSALPVAVTSPAVVPGVPNIMPPPAPSTASSALPPPPPTPSVTTASAPALPTVPAIPSTTVPSLPAAPALPNAAPALPTIPPIQTVSASSSPVPSTTAAATKDAPPTPQAAQAPGGPAKQILNTTHATVDYKIDQVGPSGIGKMEVYLTGDGGTNWQRLQEDADRRSPAEIDLPGEGLFGIRLVVTNGNGFGGTPPARGDVPTCWIEVDTTVPFIQLRPIDPAQNGALELRWTASDKNLSSEPICLYYKTRPEGQWLAIARNLKNDGLYRWTFPRDQGSQFFVKVEVADLAGNTARAETSNPIVLDMTEPHATVISVTGANTRVTGPSGN